MYWCSGFFHIFTGRQNRPDRQRRGGCNHKELACFWHRKVSWPERSKWKVISSKSLHSSDRQTSCRKPGQQLSKQASFLINTWSLQSSSAEQELRESTSCLPIWGEAVMWDIWRLCGLRYLHDRWKGVSLFLTLLKKSCSNNKASCLYINPPENLLHPPKPRIVLKVICMWQYEMTKWHLNTLNTQRRCLWLP